VSTITNGNDLPVCSDGQRLTLLRPITIIMWCGGTDVARYLRADFSWDGASIPWWSQWIFGHPLSLEYRWASLWHDIGCSEATCIEDRTIADAVFLRLLKEAGVGKYRRLAMWAAVRVYGIWVWRVRQWQVN
jgi:hypothetical protein